VGTIDWPSKLGLTKSRTGVGGTKDRAGNHGGWGYGEANFAHPGPFHTKVGVKNLKKQNAHDTFAKLAAQSRGGGIGTSAPGLVKKSPNQQEHSAKLREKELDSQEEMTREKMRDMPVIRIQNGMYPDV